MGIPENHPAIVAAARRGLIPPAPGGPPAAGRPALVAPSFAPPNVWVVPVATASEANCRDWRGRSARTQAARRAVARALAGALRHVAPFAEAAQAGRPVRVTLTRLGGRRLDPLVNLPSSLKAVEDTVCLFLGISDDAPNYRAECGQEPGGARGVRIELDLPEG